MRSMKRFAMLAGLGSALMLGTATNARADHYSYGPVHAPVYVSSPAVCPAPVVVQPAPLIYSPPVIVEHTPVYRDYPVYTRPHPVRPRFYGRRGYSRHGYGRAYGHHGHHGRGFGFSIGFGYSH